MSDSRAADAQAFTQFFEEGIPFNRTLGMRLVEMNKGRVVVRLPFKDGLIGDIFRPAIHGGVLAALIDATAGAAAFTEVTINDRLATVDLRIDYLRPAPKRDLLAVATVRRMGKRIAVVSVIVTPEDKAADMEGEAVAEGRCVFNVVRDVGPPGGFEIDG